ncbi:MAG: hypothetical protein OXI87_04035 [Albidovulum sp.]|nr:hypothetical protein [Albidovulum sp.]MDE0530565.1 hypothetical protein [Albidovulum sp.]
MNCFVSRPKSGEETFQPTATWNGCRTEKCGRIRTKAGDGFGYTMILILVKSKSQQSLDQDRKKQWVIWKTENG